MVYDIIGAILVGVGSVGLVLGYLSDLLKSKNIQNLKINLVKPFFLRLY